MSRGLGDVYKRQGKFSSDRTIQEYVDDIWKLDKIEVNTEGC